MIRCPHCGEDLSEVGVIELVGFVEHPDGNGQIPYEVNRSNRLDDSEGYICGHCSENLNWEEHFSSKNDDSDYVQIFGEVA